MSCARGCCETQAEHYRAVVVRPGASAEARRETQTSRDLAAYKRMVDSGAEPKTFVGAAALERDAKSPVEIKLGHVIRNDRLRREVESAHASAPPPATTPIDS
jgi:hypothetical protein